MNPFKLLVMAIVVVAVLCIFYSYVAQMFFQQNDLKETLLTIIESAQLNEGKLVDGGTIALKQGQSASAESIETIQKIVIFECTSPMLCCKSPPCDSAIRFDEKTVAIEKNTETGLFARCTYEKKLYVCRAFLGEKKPAQIEISALVVGGGAETIDLSSSELADVSLSLYNSGEIDAREDFSVEAFLEKKENKAGIENWVEVEKEELSIQGITKKSTIPQQVSFEIPYAAQYRARAVVYSEEIGRAEKTTEFEAVGKKGNCAVLEEGDAEVYPETGAIKELRGLVVSKANCSGCETAADCANAWKDVYAGATVVQSGSWIAYVVK